MAKKATKATGYKADATTQVTVRPNRLEEKAFLASQQNRGRKMIDDWIKALRAAENPEKPNRELLYNLYHNLMTDGDLISEWETRRKLRLTGASYALYDADGKPVEEATKLLKGQWFAELLSDALDSKLFGHSLIEVKALNGEGQIAEVSLIPRRHVIPEFGKFIDKVGDEKGIFYRDDVKYNQWLFEFGKVNDLGLLSKAAPYILFMRFALSAWSEYAEKFVMPVRIAKTNTKDIESLNRLDNMLIDMATSSYAILDKDEEFEFIETSKSDGSNVFDKLIDKCAGKLSKLLNGAVIGEASQGGSRSKEEVGQDLQNSVTNADMMWFEGMMNQTIIPKLVSYGYPIAGLSFEFERSKDLVALLEIVKVLFAEYDVPVEYITDTFGVPVTKKEFPKPQPPITASAGESGFFA